jgi:hypothetical protein
MFSPQNNPPNSKDGWQAGTCETPTCAPDSGSFEFYETAGGHPKFGITQFIVKHKTGVLNEEPEVDLKTLRVDLPVGLSVNPGATPQCAAARPKDCPLSTRVGESQVTVSQEIISLPLIPPVTITAQVYNLKPKPGQPARFGFTVEPVPALPLLPPSDVFLEADVAWESDYHEGFTIHVPKVEGVKLLKNRLIFDGRAPASTRREPSSTPTRPTLARTPWAPGTKTPAFPPIRPSSSRSCRPAPARKAAARFPSNRRSGSIRGPTWSTRPQARSPS